MIFSVKRPFSITVINRRLDLDNVLKLRSGAAVRRINKKEADNKNYLTRNMLRQFHLAPDGSPVGFEYNEDGSVLFYFDPETVVEADPELWYSDGGRAETETLPSGSVIEKMNTKRAASFGYYTKEALEKMNLEVIEEPVAYNIRRDKSTVYFFDKKTTIKMPLMCIKCGGDIRFKKKLCRACYEEELAVRRAEGDIHRNAYYGMDRKRVLFFDLELTGFYDRDEIISISICDGTGDVVMNTFVKPVHTKKWKRTEKIHGITPEMTADSPTLEELTPEIKRLFAEADAIIAYGVSTDYSHIKKIYETEKEQLWLHSKIRCCANEFVRYIHEHRPDVVHASLTDAMACMEISWEGIAHTSIADTIACRAVWERLFPHYYESEEA